MRSHRPPGLLGFARPKPDTNGDSIHPICGEKGCPTKCLVIGVAGYERLSSQFNGWKLHVSILGDKTLRILFLLFLAGCASSDPTQTVVKCSRDKWLGTMLVQYKERSPGTCGALPDIVTEWKETPTVDAGCAVLSDTWTDDSCKHTVSEKCDSSIPGKTYTVETTGIVTQKDTAGTTFSGPMTVTAKGDVSCFSTYDVTYTKQ